ncbi:MAG: hypothetical protein WAM14_07650 [Candidatus Nitrosopolaris sp.]
MNKQINKNIIKYLRTRPKFEQRKYFYVPVFLFLASIVVYFLVHPGYQLESYGYAIQFPDLYDPRIAGVLAAIMMGGLLYLFIREIGRK